MRSPPQLSPSVNNEIQAVEKHIMYMDQLTDELRHKMEAISESDMGTHSSQQKCYKENIADLQCGLTFWQNKICTIESKLKSVLNKRENTRNLLDSHLNDLKHIKQSLESTETESCGKADKPRKRSKKKAKIKTKDQNKDTAETPDFTKIVGESSGVDMNECNSAKTGITEKHITVCEQHTNDTIPQSNSSIGKFDTVTTESNNSKIDFCNKRKEDKANGMYYSVSDESITASPCGMKEQSLQENIRETLNEISEQSDNVNSGHNSPESVCIYTNSSTGMKDVGTNIELDIPALCLCKVRHMNVATQTSFPEVKVLPKKHYPLPQIKNIHRNKTTYSNIYNATPNAKYNELLNDNNIKDIGEDINKPSVSHASNIYQTMANNSFHSSSTFCTSKIISKQVAYKKSDHCIIYCQKDLDGLLAPSKTACYNLNSDDYSNIYSDNYHSIKEGDKGCFANSSSVQGSKNPFIRNRKLKPLTKEMNNGQTRSQENKLPFSFCPNEYSGTWSTGERCISRKSSAKSLLYANSNCASTSCNSSVTKRGVSKAQSREKEHTVLNDNSIVSESQRSTPINVRIVKRMGQNCTKAKQLSPIVQKMKVPVKYPISPKFRKPRSYTSAFVRKKRFVLKHGTF